MLYLVYVVQKSTCLFRPSH